MSYLFRKLKPHKTNGSPSEEEIPHPENVPDDDEQELIMPSEQASGEDSTV